MNPDLNNITNSASMFTPVVMIFIFIILIITIIIVMLFCKIWRMTNDVEKIREILESKQTSAELQNLPTIDIEDSPNNQG